METILLEFPKGLRQRISNVLNSISEKTTESTDKNKIIVEFIGTLNNPVALLHTLDASFFEHISILGKY